MERKTFTILPLLWMVTGVVFALTNETGGVVTPVKCNLQIPATCTKAVSQLPTPAQFSVTYETTAGNFTVDVEREWAPAFADRFWMLSLIQYQVGAPFYRVNYISAKQNFVVQFGYRVDNTITDVLWDDQMTDNTTWSVHSPGNVRGSVAYSMNAGSPGRDNCTNPDYCAIGFSTNIFINYGNNSRLDRAGFSIFGSISREGMAVVDRLYDGYGEVADLCGANSTDTYCKGIGKNATGVAMNSMLTTTGKTYINSKFPKLDKVSSVVVTV